MRSEHLTIYIPDSLQKAALLTKVEFNNTSRSSFDSTRRIVLMRNGSDATLRTILLRLLHDVENNSFLSLMDSKAASLSLSRSKDNILME
jgi:hypothetical protein